MPDDNVLLELDEPEPELVLAPAPVLKLEPEPEPVEVLLPEPVAALSAAIITSELLCVISSYSFSFFFQMLLLIHPGSYPLHLYRDSFSEKGFIISNFFQNLTLISVPSPSILSKLISALCISAICLTMASPRPVPPISLERPLSTR